MARKNTSAGGATTNGGGNSEKAKRPKRDWTKDRFVYNCAIELPTEGGTLNIEQIKETVKQGGGTLKVRNRTTKRGVADEAGSDEGETPTNEEIESAQ